MLGCDNKNTPTPPQAINNDRSLMRRIKYLQDNCLTKNYHTDLFLLVKKFQVVRTFSRHLVFDLLFYERKDCPLNGDSEATINSLSSQKYLDTLRNMFVECSTQYTSFSSRKRPANAGTERKQFTENTSAALQQPILKHAHTKCPPVGYSTYFKDVIQYYYCQFSPVSA